MSAFSNIFDLQDQICYVQCGFCATILLVSVPCSSLSNTVTVKCGHCNSLLSVNMMKASFVPLNFLASLTQIEQLVQQKEESSADESRANATKTTDQKLSPSTGPSSDTEDEDDTSINNAINKPPEKRQRAPSAYNHFIKEEIKRLKKEDPTMSHKEAFSTAAKNWANFPNMRHKGSEESYDQAERDM
uniref:YABBY transcription factor n=1 Tax=Kalanchoe fedtschenkoi TaxID=63787 RepID=A0A7N0ZYU5_KALFE